jgi:hypothetical protein
MAWGNQYGYNQPVIPQPQITSFINVPSEEVAYKWRVDPNTSVNFINENDGFVYRKSVGMSILEPFVFEVYQLVKIGDNKPKEDEHTKSAPDIDLSEYITKSEFETYKQTIDEMKKIVEELKG